MFVLGELATKISNVTRIMCLAFASQVSVKGRHMLFMREMSSDRLFTKKNKEGTDKSLFWSVLISCDELQLEPAKMPASCATRCALHYYYTFFFFVCVTSVRIRIASSSTR